MKANPTPDLVTPPKHETEGSDSPISPKKPRIGFWWSLLIGPFFCIVAVAVAVVAWLQYETITSIRTTMDEIHPWLTLGRVSVLVSIIVFWESLAYRLGRWQRWDEQQLAVILSMRWPFSAMLVAMELLVVQNGLRHLVHWGFGL